MLKITGRVTFKIQNSAVTAVLLISCTMKTWKLKLFYCQRKHSIYPALELRKYVFLGNLSLNEGKNSVGLPDLVTSRENQEYLPYLPVY